MTEIIFMLNYKYTFIVNNDDSFEDVIPLSLNL